MAAATIKGIRLAGLASAVPITSKPLSQDSEIFGEDEVKKIGDSIGVDSRHVVTGTMCTSDLCFEAAERLLADLGWERDTIDLLVFVSQTPDYLLPATSCSLHGRLGLAKHCAAFDLNLGCSGYAYGLWVAASLLANGGLRRGLLLVGDTISRLVSPLDRSTALLFGDAGTATALEQDLTVSPWFVEAGTDGSGQQHLIVPAGAFRQPHTMETALPSAREGGNIRSEENLFMDGAEIFAFSLREVPSLIKTLLAAADWSIETVDAVVMHQANRFMLQHLAKRLRLPPNKVLLSLEQFGNTSSASIPLTITTSLAEKLRSENLRLLLVGFGVGFSWSGIALTCGPMVVSELILAG